MYQLHAVVSHACYPAGVRWRIDEAVSTTVTERQIQVCCGNTMLPASHDPTRGRATPML